MDAAKRYIALRLRLRGEEEWEVSYVLICCYSGLGVFFCGNLMLRCSAIVRAQDAEEALKALKGGLAKAAPESFMLWLHR